MFICSVLGPLSAHVYTLVQDDDTSASKQKPVQPPKAAKSKDIVQ